MRHVLLVGPPGAGKSTLIEIARGRGIRAEDLEQYEHEPHGYEKRLAKARVLAQEIEEGFMLVGMADIDPIEFPESSLKIMLLPSRAVYEQRLQARDALHPHKSGQEGLEWKYGEFIRWSKQFAHVIVNDSTPEQTLSQVLSLL